MLFLVFGYIVDVVPESDPKISLGVVLGYLCEGVYSVGHVVRWKGGCEARRFVAGNETATARAFC